MRSLPAVAFSAPTRLDRPRRAGRGGNPVGVTNASRTGIGKDPDGRTGSGGMTRLAICGGTYSNPYALRAFIARAHELGADRLVCLGDFGGVRSGARGDPAAAARQRHRVHRRQLRGRDRSGRGRLRLRLRRRRRTTRSPRSPTTTPRHTSAEFASWMRTLPTERRENDRRGRPAPGARIHAGAQRLLVGVAARRRAPRARRRLSGADVICCTHSGLPWISVTHRRHPRGQRRRAGPAGQRRQRRRVVRRCSTSTTGRAGPSWCHWTTTGGAGRSACAAAGLPERVRRRPWRPAGGPPAWKSMPPAERSRGRFQLYRRRCRSFARQDGSGATAPATARRRAAGAAAVRLGVVPAAAVALHQLPLQPGLRLLLGRLIPEGAAAEHRPGPVPGAGRRGGRRRVHASCTSPAASRSCDPDMCGHAARTRRPSGSTWSA